MAMERAGFAEVLPLPLGCGAPRGGVWDGPWAWRQQISNQTSLIGLEAQFSTGGHPAGVEWAGTRGL